MINHIQINENILQYIRNTSLRESHTLKKLRYITNKLPERNMQIFPEQAQFISLLIKLMKAKMALEIGVFTGYSSICIAKSLPENGKLIACDNNIKWTDIAKKFWKIEKINHKISLHINDALLTLKKLLLHKKEYFDFIFIDADKENYINYYEYSLKLLKAGGLILFDNTLWSGKVTVSQNIKYNADTKIINDLNNFLLSDNRVEISLLPFADGITLALKK
uniref:O-methyltransferase family 3 n=1 Tax=uncultured organism TaxID=155900 RepID=G8DB24_9ZZZZ|nr:O-methyltransferase family 3 [uncultured organism]